LVGLFSLMYFGSTAGSPA